MPLRPVDPFAEGEEEGDVTPYDTGTDGHRQSDREQ